MDRTAAEVSLVPSGLQFASQARAVALEVVKSLGLAEARKLVIYIPHFSWEPGPGEGRWQGQQGEVKLDLAHCLRSPLGVTGSGRLWDEIAPEKFAPDKFRAALLLPLMQLKDGQEGRFHFDRWPSGPHGRLLGRLWATAARGRLAARGLPVMSKAKGRLAFLEGLETTQGAELLFERLWQGDVGEAELLAMASTLGGTSLKPATASIPAELVEPWGQAQSETPSAGPVSLAFYTDGVWPALHLKEVARYMRGLGFPVSFRGTPFYGLPLELREEMAGRLAGAVMGIGEPDAADEQRELHLMAGQATGRLPYDGFQLQRVYARLMGLERGLPIIFTSRLVSTWEGETLQARTAIYGWPAVISSQGLVVAPAKPAGYYGDRGVLDLNIEALKGWYRGRFLDDDDPRLTEVAKGYVLQAVCYYLWGSPFCRDKGCRLYNAQTQEDMLYAQLGAPSELCPQHADLLSRVRDLRRSLQR